MQTLLVSCEQMLDVESPTNQISKEEVFNDVQTANAALAGLYANLWERSMLSGQLTTPYLSTYTDDLDCFATTETNGVLALFQNQQIDTNSEVYNVWSATYQQIYAANLIIEGAQHSQALPAQEKNRITGEALLIRSILLLYLQQIYGDIPYPISTDYKINQILGKASEQQALQNLEADLNQSISFLSDDYRNSERIYPNRKVAQLLLAKVYLLEKRYLQAEQLLKLILQSPQYQFQGDITKVFTKTGTHILWQLKPKNPTDPTKEATLYYFTAVPSLYTLSADLIASFSMTDLRKQNWITPVVVNGKTFYRSEKYKARSNNTSEYSVVFRLEEVYLNLAEALTQQGKIDEALPYLNATRQRANLSGIGMPVSQDSIFSEIALENRREFFTEMGHRFFDLKRMDRLSILKNTKPNWKDYHRIWPLPQKDLLANPNLNPQNTGY